MTQSGKKSPLSFDDLINAYQQRVRNICFGFLKNTEDAEDAAQEVFIEILHSLERFRDESQISTWIHRIAVNKSLDMIRKMKRKKRWGELKRVTGLENDMFDIEDTNAVQPDEELEKAERIKLLEKAIEKLPENQRTALTLSQIEGVSYNEIADMMGTSLSAVESLIFRAKQNIRKRLHVYFEKSLR